MIEEFVSDFVDRTVVGKGGSSVVYRSKYLKTNTNIALKQINLDPKYPEDLEALKNEIEIHKKIDYPLIAQFFAASYTNQTSYVVLEFAGEQTLLEYLNSNGCLTEAQAKKFFIQIISSLQYLHTKLKLLHGDIKLDNVMIDHNNNAILIDFGLCTELGTPSPGFGGTFQYTAPEVFDKQTDYTGASDIWSAGIILYAMLFSCLPFDNDNDDRLEQEIKQKNLVFDPAINISAEAKDLLLRLLNKNPAERITIQDIATQGWIANSPYANLLNTDYTDQPALRVMPSSENDIDQKILNDIVNQGKYQKEEIVHHIMTRNETKDVLYYKMKRLETLKKQIDLFRQARYRPPREIPLTFLSPFPIPCLTEKRKFQRLVKI